METEETALGKYLSVHGVASRRKSVELVKAGLVSVNGETVLNPAARVTEKDRVEYNGQTILPVTRKYYILLHKPRGYICTNEDEHAAKKAVDLIRIPGNPRLFSAGRLDKDSEGLILFSNDGDFVEQLTHPSHRVRKTYEVSFDHPLSPRDISLLLRGVRDAGEILKALDIERIGERKYRLLLGEGRNREIRRMAAAVNNSAVRLKRVSVGRLNLGSLPCGEWRDLTEKECTAALASDPESAQNEKNIPERTPIAH